MTTTKTSCLPYNAIVQLIGFCVRRTLTIYVYFVCDIHVVLKEEFRYLDRSKLLQYTCVDSHVNLALLNKYFKKIHKNLNAS